MHKIWASSGMDYSWLRMLMIGGGCVGLGYIMGRKPFKIRMVFKRGVTDKSNANVNVLPPPYDGKTDLHEIEQVAEIMDEFKMVLVVRNDLKMGKGKIAAQCSHATLGLYKKLFYRAPKALQRWEMCGQVKVVTRVDSEEELLLLQNRGKTLKLPTHITIDAGKTQIAPNSRTVMAVLETNLWDIKGIFVRFIGTGPLPTPTAVPLPSRKPIPCPPIPKRRGTMQINQLSKLKMPTKVIIGNKGCYQSSILLTLDSQKHNQPCRTKLSNQNQQKLTAVQRQPAQLDTRPL